MEFSEVVKRRRTTRQFKNQFIEPEKLERVLQCGLMAPSFDHMRRWNFIVVTDDAAKKAAIACVEPLKCVFTTPANPFQEMVKIAFPKQYTMFDEAPCLILPLYKRDPRIINEVGPRTLMDCAEIWCVIENMFLAATNEGLSCSMRIPTAGQPEQILRAVGCPDGFTLPCMIGVGYPADDAEYPTQVYPKLEDCVHWNKW